MFCGSVDNKGRGEAEEPLFKTMNTNLKEERKRKRNKTKQGNWYVENVFCLFLFLILALCSGNISGCLQETLCGMKD